VVHDSGHKVIKQSKKPTTSKKAASNRTRWGALDSSQ
jgi:hypothetical protein